MVEQRLPAIDGDEGHWGEILNQFLSKEHYNTGLDDVANGAHQKITIRPGTASAGTAPLKFTSGTLLTTPEAGAMEFAGDNYYLTQTTGATRKKIAAYDDTSGTTGDIYYRNSSGYFTRLGIGGTGTVLTVSGGLPSWSAIGNGSTITVKDANFTLQDDVDTTKQAQFQLSGISASTTRTLTLPNANTTLVGTGTTDTLTNKTLTSPVLSSPRVDQILDTNGAVSINLYARPSAVNYASINNGVTGGDVQYSVNGTDANINIGLRPKGTGMVWMQDSGASGIARFRNNTGTTNWWDFTSEGAGTDISARAGGEANVGIDLVPKGTGTVKASGVPIVTTTGTQTLTNKTLTSPIISTISNTGTLTLPTSTDTLVGRATTDTLTNKTLTSPTLSTASTALTVGTASGGTTTPSKIIFENAYGTNTPGNNANLKIQLYSGYGFGVSASTLEYQTNTYHKFFVGGTEQLTISNSDVTIGGASIVTTTGTQTLTNKTLTSPKIGTIKDTNGATIVELQPAASPTANLRIYNGIDEVWLYVNGSAAATNLYLQAKGAGSVFVHTDSGDAKIGVSSASSNVDMNLSAKGTGVVKANGVPVVTTTGTQTLTNKTISASSNTISNIAVSNLAASAVVTAAETIAANNNDTTIPTSAAVKSYVDSTGSGDASTNTATSVDSEVAVFSGTTGKLLKRATGSGIAKLTSGVLSTVTAPSGTIVGTTDAQTLTNKTISTSTIVGPVSMDSPGALIVYDASLVNQNYTINSNMGAYPAYNAFSKYLWHDLLRFGRWVGSPTYETYNGSVWSGATNPSEVFSGKEATGYTLANGTTTTAVRWTWNSGNLSYSYLRWWVIGFGYTNPAQVNDVLVESSADGVAWTTRHTSTTTANAAPAWFSASDHGAASYLRLTITTANAQPIYISSIKGLSARWANQGGGAEYEYPYDWDASRNITIGSTSARSDGALNIGTTSTTTAAGGIYFGNDTNLYRSAANTLKTDDNLAIGTSTQTATATPANINLGGTYGNNTVGTQGNLKLRLYDNGSGSNHIGLGISDAKLEYQVPNGSGHHFYVNGVERLKITNSLVQIAGVDVVTTSGTQTLTNKTLTSPAITGNTTVTGNLTVDNGTSTLIDVVSDDGGTSGIRLYGASQGTGYVEVGQSTQYGGGMYYNGDGSPAFATGEAIDTIGFYRNDNNARSEVFYYSYGSDDVIFNGAISVAGAITSGGVAVPTISSTHTLTNKTISLANNTLTTTLAQLNTAISDATLIKPTSLFNNMGDAHTTRTSFDAQGAASTVDFGWRFVQGNTNGPGTNSASQYYSTLIGLGEGYAYSNYAMQIAYPRNVTNPYISIRYEEGGAFGAWQKISAGYADTAGSATTATTLQTARTINGVSFDGSANITVADSTKLPLTGGTISGPLYAYTTGTTSDDWQNSPISIRERGQVGNTQSGNEYAPNLNFHWASTVSNSLWMNTSGHLSWGSYSSGGVPATDGTIKAGTFVGALSGNATTATTATTAAYVTNGIADNTNSYMNFRVMRNSNSSASNDGMYIGYGNTNSGDTRLYGGGNTATPVTIGNGGTVTASGTVQGTRLISTIATGTAPLTVSSTTAVTNLNADMLDGLHAASFATLTGTETLTNKTLTAPVLSGTITGTYTFGGTPTFPATVVTTTGTQTLTNKTINLASNTLTTTLAQLNTAISDASIVDSTVVAETLRANRNLNGGGTITVDASGYVLWSARFIVIANGRGSNFATAGYFDITCPTSGTITGVGGASNVTATAAGIPLATWTALYYILPLGSGSASLAANFRVVTYMSNVDIPHDWVLICMRNGDNGAFTFNNGITLTVSQSMNSIQQTNVNTVNTLVRRDASGNFSAGTITAALSGNATTATTLQTARNINGTSFNGSANITTASWGTSRTLAGNAVDGSANVAFTNKFIVQGTADAGLSGAQFLGALGTGIVKNTTTTGVLSIAAAGTDYITPTGTETLSNKTLTAPKIVSGGFIADANGNEQIIFTTTTSAVNEITITNAATGNKPTIAATGTDTNVTLNLTSKGSGTVQANGNPILTSVTAVSAVTGTPSASTYLRGDGTWATVSSGDASTNTATSVDSEIALFSGTGGKTLKRATGSGIAKLTSGVLSAVTAPTGTIVGTTDTQTLTNKTISGASNTLSNIAISSISATGSPSSSTYLRGDGTWSPGGITRFISVVSTNTTLGSSANTDYVTFSNIAAPTPTNGSSRLTFNNTLSDAGTNPLTWTLGSASYSSGVVKYGSHSINTTSGGISGSTATAPGTGDFTVEFWAYPTSTSSRCGLFDTNTSKIRLEYITSGVVSYRDLATGLISSSTNALTLNGWNHIAICRSGTSTRLFINGTQAGSTYTDSTNYTPSSFYIGVLNGGLPFPGYIDDFRYTCYAFYTSSFTPPSSELPITAPAWPILTLPTAVTNTNLYILKNINATSVTIATTSSQTIDGASTITLATNDMRHVISDGSNWRTVVL